MKYSTIFLLLLPVIINAFAVWETSSVKGSSDLANEKSHTHDETSFRNHEMWTLKAVRANPHQQNSSPSVKILLPEDKETFTWESQIRYAIEVSDAADGESRYGEINANEVLLEIAYMPVSNAELVKEQVEEAKIREEHQGLTLMKKSTCFGCHADKNRTAGPSFSEIAEKYEQNSNTIKTLGNNIVQGSSGIWGSLEMPAHPDFTLEEAMQIADYILEQGGKKHHWVYPGLEGTIRIINKPENDSQGVYILTASYTSQSQVRGQHTIVLEIN